MYKTKLQELCHQKRWGLPKYSALRDGPDHDPRFKASVSVNGASFDCPESCRSSKQAHNEAAKLAYLHFTSPFPAPLMSTASEVDEANESPPDDTNSSVVNTGSTSAQPKEGGPKIGETCHGRDVQSDSSGTTDNEGFEKNYQYKNQLQNYAKWKQLDVPLYFNENEGPPHALNYKATVIVAGRAFRSSEVRDTPEEAEDAVAKAALSSLLLDSFSKNNFVSYKNLLLELTQEEGFFTPAYKTTQDGPPHSLTFISIVAVEGEIYRGKAANSKKQAEENAAMVAYTALNEHGLDQTSEHVSSNLVACEALETSATSGLTKTVDSRQNLKHERHSTSSPAIKHQEQAKESKAQEAASLKVWIEDSSSVCSNHVPSSPESCSSSSAAMLKVHNPSAQAISDVTTKNTRGTQSYLLGNRFRVYPYYPDIEFPEGIIVLPIRDNKWVAVSLEFPNETAN